MVGIEVDEENRIAHVRLAKQWSRKDINTIPESVLEIYKKVQWDDTFTDLSLGISLIRNIESELDFIMHRITTQKNIKDPEEIEKIKVMDQVEMTQLVLSLKQAHMIKFPTVIGKDMATLQKQIAVFSEHATEQGNVSYYAPGEELDDLVKALMICCFAARHMLQHGEMDMLIQKGFDDDEMEEEELTEDEKYERDFFLSMISNHPYEKKRSSRVIENLETYDAFSHSNSY